MDNDESSASSAVSPFDTDSVNLGMGCIINSSLLRSYNPRRVSKCDSGHPSGMASADFCPFFCNKQNEYFF